MDKKIFIVGAGPAGLTAAHELIKAGFLPCVAEVEGQVGGLSKTVVYKGNRIDIGGHRFFSKSKRVTDFWAAVLPVETETYRPETNDRIMLLRNRLSRILFLRKFYDYPLSLSAKTLGNLGLVRTWKIGWSYLMARIAPVTPEQNLADFFTNRFGKELYATFFRDYTEKVWGVPCTAIPAEWGAQRVKGLSITQAVWHALKRICKLDGGKVETSLIEEFHYPKYGPGHLWEEVAQGVEAAGGSIRLRTKVVGIAAQGTRITSVVLEDEKGNRTEEQVEHLLSSMPVRELIGLLPDAPAEVRRIARELPYRDFITVGVLLDKRTAMSLPDNWIYVQEPDLKMGRIQVFNNWSPYLVAREDTVWLGLEYFCQEGDELWNMPDAELQQLAVEELQKIKFVAGAEALLDAVVIREKKAYPAYFGSYNEFSMIQDYVSQFENLFLIGRNGQHRYNNMDHSMLTAMLAADVISGRSQDKQAIWEVNTEDSYHEKK